MTIVISCGPEPHERLLDPESEIMVTTLSLMFLLWQPDPTCVSCGGSGYGGFPVEPGHGHGHKGLSHVWNYCKGEVWSLQVSKNVGRLGTYVPGGDPWAFQMHGGIPVSAPVIVPAPAQAPAPAPSTTAPAPAPDSVPEPDAPMSPPAGPTGGSPFDR
jgi:hypothetical protein